jgi:hypothetical protein
MHHCEDSGRATLSQSRVPRQRNSDRSFRVTRRFKSTTVPQLSQLIPTNDVLKLAPLHSWARTKRNLWRKALH